MKIAKKEEVKNFEEVNKKMNVAIFKSLRACRALGSLMATVDVLPSYECKCGESPTMATNGISIYYHPDFVLKEEMSKLISIILHEVMHILFNDCDKERNEKHPVIVTTSSGAEVMLFNIATDYALASFLTEIWRNSSLQSVMMEPEKCMLYEEKYHRLSAERIYSLLLEKAKKTNSPNGKNSAKDLGIDENKMSEHIEGKADSESPSEREKKTASQRLKEAFKKEITNERIKNKGNLPQWMAQLESMLFPKEKINWKDLLNEMIEASFKSLFRMLPPAKKYLAYDLILPSVTGEHVEFYIAVDTSGSMTTFLPEIYGLINHSFQKFESYKVTLIEADAAVEAVKIYGMGEDFTSDLPRGCGGGGTSFVPAYEWVEQDIINNNNSNKALLIYITDGFGEFPKFESQNFDTIWVIPEGQLESDKVPFGRVVNYEPESN